MEIDIYVKLLACVNAHFHDFNKYVQLYMKIYAYIYMNKEQV